MVNIQKVKNMLFLVTTSKNGTNMLFILWSLKKGPTFAMNTVPTLKEPEYAS